MHRLYDRLRNYQVFVHQHPGDCGCEIESDVTLEWDADAGDRWSDWKNGDDRPSLEVVGRSPTDLRHYKRFRSADVCRQAGYLPLPGTPGLYTTWAEYVAPEKGRIDRR